MSLKSKLSLPMPVTRNLLVFAGIFSVSVSWLHLIVPPLRLLGLVILTVPLIKEPLLKVTCATSEEPCVRLCFTVLLFKEKVLKWTSVRSMMIQFSLEYQNNITISLEHVSSSLT